MVSLKEQKNVMITTLSTILLMDVLIVESMMVGDVLDWLIVLVKVCQKNKKVFVSCFFFSIFSPF